MPTLGKTVTCQHDIIFQSESQKADLVFFAGAISMLKKMCLGPRQCWPRNLPQPQGF